MARKKKKQKNEDKVEVLIPGLPTEFNQPIRQPLFGDKVSSFFRKVRQGMGSVIFRRTFMLTSSLLILGFGVYQSIHHRSVMEYQQMMTVTPVDQRMQFALTNTGIEFKTQYRDGDVYALPFEINSFDRLSSNARNYEVMLQGKQEMIDENMQAKLYLFGDSGKGVILLKGKFNGGPMNVYIQSNASILGDISSEFVEVDPGIYNPNADDQEVKGTITIDGNEIPISQDMVMVTVNPSADNVRKVDGLTMDAPASTIYELAVAGIDYETIDVNVHKLQKTKESLIKTMREYESRLTDDKSLSDADRNYILQADEIAIDSYGNETSLKMINTLLAKAGVGLDEDVAQKSVDVESMTADEMDKQLERNVESQLSGKSGGASGMTTLQALDVVRQSLMSANQNMKIYEVKKKKLGEIVKEQDGLATSVSTYSIITPF